MNVRQRRTWVKRAVALLGAVTLLGGLAVSPSTAQEATDCPEIMTTDQLSEGMLATGYTVRDDRTIETFQAEILGVQQDALGPGRDLIIADLSGGAFSEDEGIWAGMSGSPVYFDDKLVGSVSYGLSTGASSIGGLTPAQDLMDLLDYPTGGSSDSSARTAPESAPVSARTARAIERATGESTSSESSFQQLKAPLALAGLNARRVSQFADGLEREGVPLIATSGSAASAADVPAPGATFERGDNFTAGLSYGDVTSADIGTVTFACDGMVVAFGHPFFWDGEATYGANAASTITVVDDPTYGSYELVSIEEGAGTVDQDRLAGLRATLGGFPAMIPITSTVSVPDLGRTRDGETDVVDSDFVPTYAFAHMFSNVDSLYDQIGAGGSTLSWTVTGTRESGEPWEFTRDNMFVSDADIAFDSFFELEQMLNTIYYNDFEDVEFTGVNLTSSVDSDEVSYMLDHVLVSTDGVTYEDKRKVKVFKGDPIYLQAVLEPDDGGEDVVVDLGVTMTKSKYDAYINIQGGSFYYDDYYYYDYGYYGDYGYYFGKKTDTLDELLDKLGEEQKNNELKAELRGGRRGKVKSEDVAILERVVSGYDYVNVRLKDGGGGDSGKPAPGE